MPVTTPKALIEAYRGEEEHFIQVLEALFIPAVEAAGYRPIKPVAEGAQFIHKEILRNLKDADMVLCDMSAGNSNVFFELGLRTSLNKPVCYVTDDVSATPPFDLQLMNYHRYDHSLNMHRGPGEKAKLTEHIVKSAEHCEGTNSMWRVFCPSTGEQQSHVHALTGVEEVALAAAQILKETVSEKRQERRTVVYLGALALSDMDDSEDTAESPTVRNAIREYQDTQTAITHESILIERYMDFITVESFATRSEVVQERYLHWLRHQCEHYDTPNYNIWKARRAPAWTDTNSYIITHGSYLHVAGLGEAAIHVSGPSFVQSIRNTLIDIIDRARVQDNIPQRMSHQRLLDYVALLENGGPT